MINKRHVGGMWLIVIAVILILGKLGVISFLGKLFWPALLLIPALIFHYLYFSRILPSGILFPSGILITYSLIFFYCNWFGWHSLSYLWPGFIFGIAVGLYEIHFFDPYSQKEIYTLSIILAIIAAVFFGLTILFTIGIYFIAVVLVAAGIWMLLRRSRIA